MSIFITGLILFLSTHVYSALRSRAPGQDIRKRIGYAPYMGLYSLLSLTGFICLIYGFGKMGPEPIIYNPPSWGAHLNWLLMYMSLIALAAYMFPAGFIKKALKHPMLVSVKLWAIGHLLANGNLRDVLLFGGFLAYAVISRIAAKRRGDVGAARATAHVKWDTAVFLLGTGLYFLFALFLHQTLFNVPTGLPQ